VTPRSVYRVVSIAETITWTLLIAALIVRAASGLAIAVTIAGGIHGFVFLAYGATALLVAINQRWNPALAIGAVATAVVPFATIPFDQWLERRGKLEGAWRTEKTDDENWLQALVRWMLGHPAVLIVLLAVAVVGIFVVLLLAGPPGK
jgi:integral membrane protein